jgi:hypothetical protein
MSAVKDSTRKRRTSELLDRGDCKKVVERVKVLRRNEWSREKLKMRRRRILISPHATQDEDVDSSNSHNSYLPSLVS